MTDELKIGNNFERICRGLNRSTIPAFACKDMEECLS
jgi:hypothetical protein